DESLAAATAAVERIDALLLALGAYRQDGPDDATLDALLAEARHDFTDALDDDLNIAPALGALFDAVRELNRRIDARSLSTSDAVRSIAFIRDLDRVLGITADPDEPALPDDLASLLEARIAARAARDWGVADRLRDELADRGIVVEDTRDGQRWRRAIEVARA
ncbi:MAG TPA: DALR domain-containing protein, partial [Candidatus Limnocylindrales bacterium]